MPFTAHYTFVVYLYKKSTFLFPIFYKIMQNKQIILTFTSQGKHGFWNGVQVLR